MAIQVFFILHPGQSLFYLFSCLYFSWNANGLVNKTEELREFVEAQRPYLKETKLSPSGNFNISGYTLYETYRAKSFHRNMAGGTVIYVRNKPQHSEIFHFSLSHLKCTTVLIQLVCTYILPLCEAIFFLLPTQTPSLILIPILLLQEILRLGIPHGIAPGIIALGLYFITIPHPLTLISPPPFPDHIGTKGGGVSELY